MKLDEHAVRQGRLYIVAAALLWSTSGAFTKLLTQPTILGLNEPPLQNLDAFGFTWPVQIACYRTLFAAMALALTLRPADFSFRPIMIVSGLNFAIMNFLFVSSMALGTSANAILLQYSAPLWMYLVAVFVMKEPSDTRSAISMWIGLAGVAIIVAGGWSEGNLAVILIGLGSGFTYAGVIVILRHLRGVSATWITVWNLGWSGLLLLPLVLTLAPATPAQYVTLVAFGVLQLGIAYVLMAKGLRTVSPQEAGTLTLLEPLLNPLWAYLVSPDTETPPPATFVGGAIILAALAWRYWPSQVPEKGRSTNEQVKSNK